VRTIRSINVAAIGIELTQEPVARFGSFVRDPSGNGWKMLEARREA
jgi:hypothetical protein